MKRKIINNDKYVISVKALRDIMGKPCEEWRYVSFDNGIPCWGYEQNCNSFSSLESAEKWFDENKEYLFKSHYNRFNFDFSTLAIRKAIYKEEKMLNK